MVDIIDEEKKKGNISEILERKNQLIRTGCGKCRSGNDSVCREKPNPNLNL